MEDLYVVHSRMSSLGAGAGEGFLQMLWQGPGLGKQVCEVPSMCLQMILLGAGAQLGTPRSTPKEVWGQVSRDLAVAEVALSGLA